MFTGDIVGCVRGSDRLGPSESNHGFKAMLGGVALGQKGSSITAAGMQH